MSLNLVKSAASAVAALTVAVGIAVLGAQAVTAAPAHAGALDPSGPVAKGPGGTVELAQWRGHRWHDRDRQWRGHRWHRDRHWRDNRWRHRGDRYYGYGPGIAAGVAAIIGGSIAASQRDHGDAWQRCDDRYNSFRWSDGTFQPYGDGPRQLCPYLSN